MVHVTNNNNGDTSIVFTGKMFSWRGVDTATGHVVVSTKYYGAFKTFWDTAAKVVLCNPLVKCWHEWKKHHHYVSGVYSAYLYVWKWIVHWMIGENYLLQIS